jgi:hypothetical protein
MTDNPLTKVLGSISNADLHVDETGRVVIDNPQISEQLRDIIGDGNTVLERHNFGCCTNGIACRRNVAAGEALARLAGQ